MDDAELSEFFANHWRTVKANCNKDLEEGDRFKLEEVQSWQDLRTIVLEGRGDLGSVPHQIDRLKPTLVHYNQFLEFSEKEMGTGFSTAFVWGLLGVILQVAAEDPRTLEKIPKMMKRLGNKIEEFNTYCRNADSVTKLMREGCFDMLTQLVEFTTALIKSIRDNTSPGSSEQWSQLEKQFTSTEHDVNETLVRLEKLTLVNSTGVAGTIASHKNTTAHVSRCFILPPTKAPRFFNRTDVFDKIDSALERNSTGTSLRSVALHGLGGIGKSAIASRYVDKKIEDNDYDAIFWVQAEKTASLRQSFTDIALRLKLDGAEPQKHEENKDLVQDWFQTSTSRWLVVYDNVELAEILMPYWPGSSHGKAIITSRNHTLAFQPASSGIEILSWDPKTGSEFLFFLLKQAIGRDIQEEGISALELSTRLNGHALGISHMAGMIQDSDWSITEFMKAYRKNPRSAHTRDLGDSSDSEDVDDSEQMSDLEAIWHFSFTTLKKDHPTSVKILGVAAFLMPDNIPQAIFEFPEGSEKIKGFKFCEDGIKYVETFTFTSMD
ncbi:uncharacterized protein J4E84_007352 [Alternaria hordeiaustralica]|uniref:uncharacterized protein n=1 Tax=Alternaria hordeiaustralica TaxID=1187925 RepID=UPI0020C525A5|nr:uncharacterized protein J4E84_007352 [Alternaria hordeiaustralica]KAI4681757.1 hypothetical protein J4E84_007352 [Alternaria hordeiaustralica]